MRMRITISKGGFVVGGMTWATARGVEGKKETFPCPTPKSERWSIYTLHFGIWHLAFLGVQVWVQD